MDISIVNYGASLSSCNIDGLITLGYEFLHAKELLSDKDFDTFLSDAITHELIHFIILEEFTFTTSKLFDTIEHFIGDYDIKDRVFKAIRLSLGKNNRFPETWHNSILRDGMAEFYRTYSINMSSLIQSYIVTGGK